MDLRQLRYFLRIAETGSFSKASESLRIAQPSLSQHVKALEEELGVVLLKRHARGISPTDFGYLLGERARDILREVERTKEAIRNAADSPAGEVLLGLPTSACRGLCVPLIDAVAERYPSISIHLVEAMSGSLDEWVRAGRIDVALLYENKLAESISSTEVMTEELNLIVASGHELAGERAVRLSAVANLPVVLPDRPHVIRRVVERSFAMMGIEEAKVFNCDSLPAIMEFVRNGRATLFPAFAMSREIASGEFVAVPVVDPTPRWRLSIVQSRTTTNARASEAIARLLHDVSCRLVERGEWPAQLKRVRSAAPAAQTGPVLEEAR